MNPNLPSRTNGYRSSADWPQITDGIVSRKMTTTILMSDISFAEARLSRPWEQLGLLIKSAVFHYEPNAPQRRDVARRITFDRDQIREQAYLDGADLIGHMQHARINRSGGAQCIDDRHSPRDHEFDLFCVVTVGEHADVAAAGDGHAGFERLLEDNFFLFDVGSTGDRQRGTERNAAFLHQAKEFRCQSV